MLRIGFATRSNVSLKIKVMETLVKKESPEYSSEFVEHNGKKFKIFAENGNSYCKIGVRVLTQNGDYEMIATEHDIPNTTKVNRLWREEVRLEGNRKNLEACKEFIKSLYA